jgi:hypothetical protein
MRLFAIFTTICRGRNEVKAEGWLLSFWMPEKAIFLLLAEGKNQKVFRYQPA